MREFAVPATFSIPEDTSMAATVYRYQQTSPQKVLFRRPDGGSWRNVTADDFANDVAAVAKGLIAAGVGVGDCVAILSSTRYEWSVLDYAIWSAAGCTVAIYESSSPSQAQWILEDSATTLLVVETAAFAELHKEVTDAADALEKVFVIDDGGLEELKKLGAEVSDDDLAQRRARVTADSPATLIYTSGTTGKPKGVELTHSHFYAEAQAVRSALGDMLNEGRQTLMFLPLAHVFARAVGVASFENGVVVGHFTDLTKLLDAFAEFQPSFILSVPRVFEKVYNSAKQKAHDGGKGKIFDAAAATAIEYSQALDTGRPGLVLKAKHTLFDKLVYSKLRAALGGQCQDAIAGGAPLGARLAHFFRGVGIPVYEGYGLTETCAAITVNTPSYQRVGTVGRPIPGQAVRIAEDGEVLAKGSVVFTGYWKNEQATAEALQDGWFHTGDLGSLDEEGYLSITGRKKEIIVTAGGKNVSPAGLEDTLRAHPLISQCMVIGDKKPFIAALITLDAEFLTGWKSRHNLPEDTTIEQLRDNADLKEELDGAVAAANKQVSHAEQIKKYRILDRDFTIEGGQLTPTLKLKRNVVAQEFVDEIDAVYGPSSD